LIFMPSDLRVVRFEDRATVTTIFVVDASGSSALHRMGEAKGAIELMLADCYVRRDRVAMIAFRGTKADVLLAPTRSLARARRALSGLAGGGATPLADGLKLALALAEGIRRAGGERQIALLTDGRANIDLAGTSDRSSAERDAMTLAGHVAAARIPAVVIDTAPRNSPRLREIALAMRARYVALPHADAHAIKTAVTSSAPRSARAM
jgi:magnesium chelatase subunit D